MVKDFYSNFLACFPFLIARPVIFYKTSIVIFYLHHLHLANQTLSFSQANGTWNVENGTRDDPTDGTTQTFALSTASLADLNADGILNVTVKSLNRNDDFFFAGSALNYCDKRRHC